ncbi:MAG TPA: heme ABC exporter ATP-binding protein CcmA [bacterium]|nr:heme ABC exporter ATP-binding protein CcmA [bacterium]
MNAESRRPNEPPAIVMERVWKVFAAPALRDVTLRAGSGEIVAVLGPNGAGKSTLLRVIAGMARPTRGSVRVFGDDPATRGARRRLGLAGHESSLAEHLTALENLQFYAALYGLPGARAAETLEEFGLRRRRDHQVRTLSRGTVQRLNLARALLHAPDLVLLDEPFTGLDVSAATDFAARIREMRRTRRCVIMTTHRVDEAATLADTVAVLVGGRLVARAPAAEVDEGWLLATYAAAAAPKPEARTPRPVGSP